VDSYAQIQQWIDFGDKNRAINETAMNKTSSRSHTVFTIELVKITSLGDKKSRMSSEINLVDLAGSEKTSQAQTSGDRLAEGTAINLSLTALGNVITALAKNSGSGKKVVVPYRDSVLTRMLQEALGGNSSTIMVCAIRPGINYYEETLNTLKYADRAKQIKNAPVVNENPQDKLIRELKEENDRLKAQIANMQSNTANGAVSDDVQAQVKRNEDKLNKIENFKVLETTQAAMNKRIISAMQTEESKNRMNPQLVNLTEDEQSNRKDVEDLTSPATCLVGRRNKSDPSKDP
jgi:hypothetical protein